MNKAEKLELIRDLHDRLEALYEAGQDDEAEELEREHWWIFNHDRNGNWIGGTRNEDGWTP